MSDTEQARSFALKVENGIWLDVDGEHALAVLLRRLADDNARLTAERAELREALQNSTEIIDGFIGYYEVPSNHPDAMMIVGQKTLNVALLSRATGEPAPTGAKGGER